MSISLPQESTGMQRHLEQLDPLTAQQLEESLWKIFNIPAYQNQQIAAEVAHFCPGAMSLHPDSVSFVMSRIPRRSLSYLEWELCALASAGQQGAAQAIELVSEGFALSNWSASMNARVATVMQGLGRIAYSFPFFRFDAMKCGDEPSLFEEYGAQVTRGTDGNKVFQFDTGALSREYFTTAVNPETGQGHWKVLYGSHTGIVSFSKDVISVESVRFGKLWINKVGRSLGGHRLPVARWSADGSSRPFAFFSAGVFCSVEAIRALESLLFIYDLFVQRYREWLFGTIPATTWLQTQDFCKQVGGGQLSAGFPCLLKFCEWAAAHELSLKLHLFQWAGAPWHLVNLGTFFEPRSHIDVDLSTVAALRSWMETSVLSEGCPDHLADFVQNAFQSVGTLVMVEG